MISIKKLLSLNTETDQTLMHVVRLLVHGIGLHAAAGEARECEEFRQSVQNVSDALATDEITSADLLIQSGSVLQALEDHTRHARLQQRLQTAELQNMVKMLTATVGIVSSVSNANVDRLSEIERQIAIASELDDVRAIKSRLSDCLADIRTEAERQRQQTGEMIEQLTHSVEQARKSPADGPRRDRVTGLPLRAEAELALAHSGRTGPQAYAAVMVLDRLPAINARFGREQGDDILGEFAGLVQNYLVPADRLYRWDGPVLVALLLRENSLQQVRTEFVHIMETKLEHTIQTASRSVLLPVVARWTLFPMMAAPRLVYQKIDTFVATPTLRE